MVPAKRMAPHGDLLLLLGVCRKPGRRRVQRKPSASRFLSPTRTNRRVLGSENSVQALWVPKLTEDVVVNRELNTRGLGHRGEPDAFPTGSGGNRADAKTPVPQMDGDRAFYFSCTPRDELQPGSGTQRNFRVPILATLRLRAACLYFLPEPSGQLPRKIPCNPLLR